LSLESICDFYLVKTKLVCADSVIKGSYKPHEIRAFGASRRKLYGK
jgi:hypothetical protein